MTEEVEDLSAFQLVLLPDLLRQRAINVYIKNTYMFTVYPKYMEILFLTLVHEQHS